MYFTPDDWARVLETHEAWWHGKLDRPLILTTRAAKPPRPQITRGTCMDFSKSPEEVIDEIDNNIANTEYYGDAFPFAYWTFFGCNCMAAYLGSPAQPDGERNTVWYAPIPGEPKLKDIHLELNRKDPLFNRCKDLYWAGVKKWKGRVSISMNDIGGDMDVLSSLLGSERLLYALLDEPKEVKRLNNEVHEIWHQVNREFREILAHNNQITTDWAQLLSKDPYSIQMCDFSYMIGTDMFDEFIAPNLRHTSSTLGHSLYHLDGIGSLKHLDTILSIEQIDAIQWQPGEGAGFGYKWIDVYRRLREAGKNMHFIGSQDDFIAVSDDVGPKGMMFNTNFDTIEQMHAFFDRFEASGNDPYRR